VKIEIKPSNLLDGFGLTNILPAFIRDKISSSFGDQELVKVG